MSAMPTASLPNKPWRRYGFSLQTSRNYDGCNTSPASPTGGWISPTIGGTFSRNSITFRLSFSPWWADSASGSSFPFIRHPHPRMSGGEDARPILPGYEPIHPRLSRVTEQPVVRSGRACFRPASLQHSAQWRHTSTTTANRSVRSTTSRFCRAFQAGVYLPDDLAWRERHARLAAVAQPLSSRGRSASLAIAAPASAAAAATRR